MKQRTFRLCVCGHKRKEHFQGQCEGCKSGCVFKEGSAPNVTPQTPQVKDNG